MLIRIEIGQYEFIELECENLEQAREKYAEVKATFKPGQGLPKEQWDKVVTSLLETGGLRGDPGIIGQMNSYQQAFVQEVKRGIKRIKYKQEHESEQEN